MSSDSNFQDESFDLNELQGSSGQSPVFSFEGSEIKDLASVSIKKYDFTNPIVLSDADLSKLKTKSEQFVYYLYICYLKLLCYLNFCLWS